MERVYETSPREFLIGGFLCPLFCRLGNPPFFKQPHHFWSTPQTPEQLRKETAEELESKVAIPNLNLWRER
jgi:hypothetical protein